MEQQKYRIIVQAAKVMLWEESSDEEPEILEKVDNYAEVIVPTMNDKQFQRNFRVSPGAFEDLLAKMHTVQDLNHVQHVGYPKTDLEKELMVTIWYLGNLESLRSVSERFGIAKSTAWDILYRTCHLLLKVAKAFHLIHWPTQDRQREISQHFFRNYGFPGIIGAIDGSHIEIIAPKAYPNSYVNRKHYHSVLLQGVCDHELLFTDVYAGEAGSIHDYTLYRRSDLFLAILNNEINFHNDSHLVGDLAYKLGRHLMVGFKNRGNLTPYEKNFNVILSRSRVVIENAFALLKGRFRRLKFVETVKTPLISLLMVLGCILHTICIRNGHEYNDILNIEEELTELRARQPHNQQDIDLIEENQQARIKRYNIMYTIPIRPH